MLAIDQPYALLLVFAALIPAVLTVAILRHRPNLGARSFSILMAAVSLWAFVALFEVAAPDLQTKIFSYQIKYIFIVIVPLAWLIFTLYYSNRMRALKRHHLILLLIVPVLTLVMVATNSFHHLMFTRFEMVTEDRLSLIYPHFGPLFWVHTLYSYIVLLAGFICLIKHLTDFPVHYRHQVAVLLIGGMTPWIANIIFIFGIGRFAYFDFTPVAFTISGMAFMWGISRYRLLDIIPIARDLIIQNMYDGVIVVDDDENIVDINQTALTLLKVPAAGVIGARAEHVISWWSALKRYPASFEKGHFPVIELEINDRPHLLRLIRAPIRVKERSLGHVLTLHDVTAAQAAQRALVESEARFKSLSENAPVIIFSLDETGVFNYVNPAWEHLLGHGRQEVLGRPLMDFIHPQNDQPFDITFKQLINGQAAAADLDIQLVHKDGSLRLFSASAATNADTEGRVTGIIGLAKDVTEEQRLQRQLIESQKMEAIGTLAGGIAHDFNNLLMGMQANLSLMRLETANSSSLHEKIRRIEDQIQNGASLTRQMLGYARKGKYALTVFDLNNLVQETLHVVKRTNKGIVVHQELSEQSANLRADQGQIELVLLNLFINAVDAMPEGGELTVSTRLMDDPREPKGPIPPVQGSWIELSVRDTGIGMDQATQKRIFEPFFTTKEMGRGTGLGLASVYGVIKNHGGSIQVHSSPGAGSTFQVILPAAQRLVQPCSVSKEIVSAPVGCGKILLVDDEPLILQYCHEMIKSLGFTVLSAQGAEEALSIYKKQGRTIDVAILDMVMPKTSGLQLLEQLKAINPEIKAIISTGYSLDSRITNAMACGHLQCLKKPYTRDELADAIARVMARQPESADCVQAGAR
jgi:PAS domain S-box-containing protein